MTQTNFKRIDELPETTSILGTDWLPLSDINNLTKKISVGALFNFIPVGTGIPAGSDTYMQFNDGGVFGADSTLYFNKTTKTLYSSYFIGDGSGVTNVAALSAITAVTADNSILWDNHVFSDYLNQSVKTTAIPSFAGLTLSSNPSSISSVYDINLKPSSNNTNYFIFKTVFAIPRITVSGLTTDLSVESPRILYYHSGDVMCFRPSGDSVNTGLKFSQTSSPSEFNIITDKTFLNLKVSGDTDDYLRLKTVANIPYLSIVGGGKFRIDSDDANFSILEFYKDDTHAMTFGYNKSTNESYLYCTDNFTLVTNNSYANYFNFSTVAGVPTIGTADSCNLTITASGGTISFDNENLTTSGTISGVNVTSGVDPGHTHTGYGGAEYMDDLLDADTATDPPARDEVLKWNGTNWVPAAYNATYAMTINTFYDNQSTPQLIGSGVWKTTGNITFTAEYVNPPPASASIACGGTGGVTWGSALTLTTPFTSGASAENTAYPANKDTTIVFTLTAYDGATPRTATDTTTFYNYVRWGASTTGSSFNETIVEALSGSSVTNSYTTSRTINAGASNYLVIAYPATYTSIHASGFIFNSVTCPFQTAETVSITNSAGFQEDYKVFASVNANLGNSTLQLSTSASLINHFYYGGSTLNTGWTGAQIKALTDVKTNVTNTTTGTWSSVTLAASEYFVFAFPSRRTDPANWYDNTSGFQLALKSLTPETVSVINENGYTENYDVFVSENILGPGAFVLRTT